MAHRGVASAVAALFVLAAALPAPAAEETRAPASVRAPLPFDVQALLRRVHFAFRPEGRRFTGGHSTYGVEFENGRLRVRPVRPSSDPPPASGQSEPPLRPTEPAVGPPLVVETSSIARRSRPLRLSEPPVVDEQGRLVRRGGAVQETIESQDDGVEVSWHFPARPEGEGDLEVRLAASGLDYRGDTSGGLHFHDPASGLGVRFGHATWIGADGRRTAVTARWNGREIVIAVAERLLDEAAYPAVLDPVIGPEFGLDSPISGPAYGSQTDPSVAVNSPQNDTFLVAWTDGRAVATGQVFATRVSAAGVVLDPDGILVSAPATYSFSPSAVYDGTNFLVVFAADSHIWGRRISPGGAVVDAAPFAISNHPTGPAHPFASRGGTTTLVVWHDYRNAATDIYAARVDGATVLDGVATGFPISTAPGTQLFPRAAYGNGQWLVAWQDRRNTANDDIYGARVSGTTGTVIDPGGIAISTAAGDQWIPRPASDGTDFLVAWVDERNAATASSDVYATRVSAAGAVVDPAGIRLCDNPFFQGAPSAAFAPGTSFYQVLWQDHRGDGLFGNRVDVATGAVLDGSAGAGLGGPAPIDAPVFEPHIIAAGAGYYAGWWTFSSESSDSNVLVSRVSTTSAVLDAPGINVARSANGQTQLAVAAAIDSYLLVWADDRNGDRAIYAARVDGVTGESMDPAGILLSTGSRETSPAVSYNGTDYLVVWQDDRFPPGVWGTRVSTAGAVLDPGGRGLFTVAFNYSPGLPDVASDGDGWFVVWRIFRPGASYDIHGGRVDATGAAIDPSGIAVSNGMEAQDSPTVGFGDGRYFVTWVDNRNAGHDLYGARVSTAGVVQDPTGIPIGTGPGWVDHDRRGIAYVTPNFMVVYSESDRVYRAGIASATGLPLDTVPLAPPGTRAPHIRRDGDVFVAVYAQTTSFGFDVKGTRLDAAGVDLDAVDWPVVNGGGVAPEGAAIASPAGGTGDALVAYSRYDPTPGITSVRARVRMLTGLDLIFRDGFE
jgi:hypothetical protein